jgi:transcription antitermination factor NusG
MTSEQTLPWYAVKVRTRSEPVAVTALRNKGYEALSPATSERRKYSDRMTVVETPAFPGYVFCRMDARQKVPVLSCPAVDYIVGFGGVLTTVPDEEIEGACRLLEAGARPQPYLAVGQKVRVEYGSLAGLEGILERVGKQNRIVVSLQLLQRSVSLDIDEDQIQVV